MYGLKKGGTLKTNVQIGAFMGFKGINLVRMA